MGIVVDMGAGTCSCVDIGDSIGACTGVVIGIGVDIGGGKE